MQIRTVLKDPVPEKSTARFTAQLQDENGVGIPSGSLTTLILTLYDVVSGVVINGRNKQDVLNLNGVTVDGSGNLIYLATPADNIVLGTEKKEWHIALFEWTFSSGAKGGAYEILFPVMNLVKVP